MEQKYTVTQLNHGRKVWDFMKWDYLAFSISILLLIISISLIISKGFNWGIDFTGGSVIEITMDTPVNMEEIRQSFKKAGFKEAILKNFGTSKDIMVCIPTSHDSDYLQEINKKMIHVINQTTGQNVIITRVDFVGPSVGDDLTQKGAMALLIVLISILMYVSYRFEWRLAIGIVIALVHDVVITMGVLALFHIEIDLTIVASLMSVIGYSLNDSIVVSDRIRENFRKIQNGTPYEIFNISLTQILYRTLITFGTTFMVIWILYLLGGPVLKGFSITMLIGVSIGTVSSIYIASAVALKLGIRREYLLQQKVEKEGEHQPTILP